MISLFATDRLTHLYPSIQVFITEQVIPLEREFLSLPFGELLPKLDALREQVKQKGWWAPPLPESEGGMGLSLTEFAQLSELMGRTPLGHYLFNCQAPDIGNMELMLSHASEALQEQFLEPLIQGETRSCFSMTEPEFAGSNPTRMATTAIRDGDDYVISGHKWFTTAADGAQFAVVMAITNPDATSPYERASMIVVPTDTPGFDRVRNISVMGESGEGYHSHAEIKYEKCRVPVSYRIGPEGKGFMLAQERLGPGRIHHCMRWIGIAERALEMMCQYAIRRELKDGRPLANMQTIQNWIAESRAEIDASRLLVLHTARKIDEEGQKAARQQISTIKFYVAGMLDRVLDRAVQSHGALGITDDTVLAYWYRHERAARIYDGPDEVHKSVLARDILKSYQE
ncbi:MAG TPA: acyl-CoA dehydrogenase [Cytophagales bacterium]|nr:acyl-CoA dehydrogenase [Cytophagales bacterium]HAA20441.1 acyl-CoA dehydrogenase [Cytophagales bacterium]HAP61311.1 acyl-CoA dehydrogenase [Cytophagales bacterium]